MPNEKKHRSLRLSVLLLLGLLISVFIIVFFSIFHMAISEMLIKSESKYLENQLKTVNSLFDSANENTLLMTGDVAVWEDTVNFVKGGYDDFMTKNWSDVSLLESYKFNFIVFKDLYGNDVHIDFYDYINNIDIPIPEGFSEYINTYSNDVIDKFNSSDSSMKEILTLGKSGIIIYNDIPYYISVMPILNSLESDEVYGTVSMGSMLTDGYFKWLTRFDSLDFSISKDTEHRQGVAYDRISDSTVSIIMPMEDINGDPVSLSISDDRIIIYTEGQNIKNSVSLMLLIFIALLIFALYFVAVKFILNPIEKLSKDIINIDDTNTKIINKYSNSKEFYELCSSINNMMSRLNDSQIFVDTFRNIFNGMEALLYVSDIDTNEILFINDKMKKMLGLDDDNGFIGKKCWELLHNGDIGHCADCPVAKLKSNSDSIVEWEELSYIDGRYYRRTDRLIDWLTNRKAHLHHRVDITDIKEAEKSLKKRLEQQELMSAVSKSFISTEDISDLITDALIMTGKFVKADRIFIARYIENENRMEFLYEWFNEENGLTAATGRSFPFMSGVPLYDAFVRDEETFLFCEDVENDEAFGYLSKFNAKSFISVPIYVSGGIWGIMNIVECFGSYKWGESDIYFIRLIDSIISAAIARDALENELSVMSSIVNSSPQFIVFLNEEGHFQYINQGALDMSGYSMDELVNGGLSIMIDDDTKEKLFAELRPKVLEEGKLSFEIPIKRKDGEIRLLVFSAFTAASKNVGIGAIASDITYNRQIERELINAKETAEESSRAKSDFLSRMSHEIRTPMNAIIGMTSIAKSSNDIEKKEYCLDKIDEASRHLLGVINDILDMSKIEANKFELSYSEFNFEKMLMRVVDVVNFRVDEKNQNLIVKIDRDMPVNIISDEQRLAQVITNLLSNAVKFTPEEGSVTLSANKIKEEGNIYTLEIHVIDNGIGISEESQKKLFRSFEQADGGISRKFGGTGLGLAISKRIIEMMGGEIWVESEINKGSSFSFRFEVVKGEKPDQRILSPEINWKTLRVLAVDDSPEVREYFTNISQSIGFTCITAEDGYDAIRIIDDNKDNAFNLIFVDWKMPGINGIELTKQIKRNYGSNIVVIMISATEWSEIEVEAKSAHVDKFVPKPLFSSQIVNCITECIGAKQQKAHKAETQNYEGYFKGYRLLLAEDIEINREIVMSMLQDTELEIDYAENGKEAYNKFAERPLDFDIIFMDIHMPEMDGYESTKLIRALDFPHAKSVPIIAMTANVFREDIERCIASGTNDHIGKPVDIEEIIYKLKKYLNKE